MYFIGVKVLSKHTKSEGTITGVEGKKVVVSFCHGGEVTVNIDDLIIDDEIRNELIRSMSSSATRKPSSGKSNQVKYKHGNKNIAFKLNYCDGGKDINGIGFANVCSLANMQYNQKHHSSNSWCNVGPCKKCTAGQITVSEMLNDPQTPFVCYETRTFIDWKGYAGEDTANGTSTPRRIVDASPKCVAVLTTVFPNEKERSIIGLFWVNGADTGDNNAAGYVSADPRLRIMFTEQEAKNFHFFDYHSNQNTGARLWGNGLVRYLLDDEVLGMLNKAIEIKKGTKDEQVANDLLDIFMKEKYNK